MILRSCLLALTMCAVTLAPAAAQLKLPSIFSSHMVLQRDRPVAVWGWDAPGKTIRIELDDTSASTRADKDGKWRIDLPALPAGGPHNMKVTGSGEVLYQDILIGEVWLCSGQSNMEWPVRASKNPEQEIAAAKHPRIRHIKIAHVPARLPMDDVTTNGWQVCSPQTVANFTGVGYYFARHLQDELDVPVGLIGSNWGGTRIEPWTPPIGFQQVSALRDIAENLADFPRVNDNGGVQHQTPLALYNGMIYPLVPYGIRGAIWYQGESNNGEGMLYFEKMKALIQGWRAVWQNDELPFYFAQLAPFRYGGDPTRLAGIWEAQAKTLDLPHTGMAVLTDIANLDDIHPRNKQDVGKRLALWALAKNYGRSDLVYSGPIYKSMEVDGNRVRISFEHAHGGLKAAGEQPLSWFEVAGEDKKFFEAEANIDGAAVIVHAEEVSNPVAVRFGWHQEAEPNLTNAAGLPASPFRTDDW